MSFNELTSYDRWVSFSKGPVIDTTIKDEFHTKSILAGQEISLFKDELWSFQTTLKSRSAIEWWGYFSNEVNLIAQNWKMSKIGIESTSKNVLGVISMESGWESSIFLQSDELNPKPSRDIRKFEHKLWEWWVWTVFEPNDFSLEKIQQLIDQTDKCVRELMRYHVVWADKWLADEILEQLHNFWDIALIALRGTTHKS